MSPTEPKVFFKKQLNSPAKTAIFLSGSGTNAEKILELWKNEGDDCGFTPVCLVTDRPGRCRAEELAEQFELELIAVDIHEFYQAQGLSSISLASAEGRHVRQLWTAELCRRPEKHKIDFGIFAGFIPLSNITDSFPCLNVHPGDLSICDEQGQRLLVGLHTLPVQYAVLQGLDHMRSSVIVACAYEAEGDGMDEGLVLGLSPEVAIDWLGHTPEELINIYKARPVQRPKGGWQDKFQKFLSHNQDILKEGGDWVVFPKVIKDFAAGKFAFKGDTLYLKSGEKFLPLEYIEYFTNNKEITFKTGR